MRRAGRQSPTPHTPYDVRRGQITETLYWHPVLVLPDGTAEISFDLTDSPTTYQVLVAAHTLDGRLAEATAELSVVKPKSRER